MRKEYFAGRVSEDDHEEKYEDCGHQIDSLCGFWCHDYLGTFFLQFVDLSFQLLEFWLCTYLLLLKTVESVIFVLVSGCTVEPIGKTGFIVNIFFYLSFWRGSIDVQFMYLFIGIGNFGDGVCDTAGSPVEHGVLYPKFMLVGYLSCQFGTALEDSDNKDLHLLQRHNDTHMRSHPEKFGLGWFYLNEEEDTLKGAEQLVEGLLMMKLAYNFYSLFGVKDR